MLKLEKIKKQVVFSDYDGTIYITEEDMPKNIKAIEEYRNLGGKFIIVTGRSKTSISNVIEKYNIPFDYIVSNNGSVIYDKDMIKIYEQTIAPEIADKIIEYLKTKKDIEIYFYDDGDKVEYHNQKLLKIRTKTYNYELAEIIENEINSIFSDVKSHANFPGRYYDNHNFALIDVVSKKAGKENAIKKLLEILNIEKEQVVSIGDGRNDIAMIKEYNGYSMETAEEDVKKSASKIFFNIADAINFLKT